jgi:uncharacterized radical SAM protein YgiQ
VKFSITSHRGCLGSCTFCSLSAHQGRIIQWRSKESVLREAERIARMPGFKGHITDVGGPSANMYAASCPTMAKGRVCRDKACTWPQRCPSLRLGYREQLAMLDAVRKLPGVKRVTIGTGIRFDLVGGPVGESYLEQLCRHHVSGQMRVAPEHVCGPVLERMRKCGAEHWPEFRRRFSAINRRLGRKQYLIPYFISGHPGATLDHAVELAEHIVKTGKFRIEQVQQYTPLPMTASAAAYHTGIDPLTGERVHVARSADEKRAQRVLLQIQDPLNHVLAERLLFRLGRPDLVRRIRRLRPGPVRRRR